MDTESSKKKTHKMAEESDSGSGADQNTLERGAEILGRAEDAVSDAYDKTSRKVSETYDSARNYSNENPGKAVLIALGIGVGLGVLLCSGSRRSRTGRFAEPVINALSDIALTFFR